MPAESTSPSAWSIGTLIRALEAADLDTESLENSGEIDRPSRIIKIPQFQRNISWNKDKQQLLINSINKGFPIGALMLYEKPSVGNRVKEYQLVDGLQRANSIWSYKKEPLIFFSFNQVGDETSALLDCISPLSESEITMKELLPILEDWRTETKTLDRNDGFSSWAVMNRLRTCFDLPENSMELMNSSVESLLDRIEDRVNIDSTEIPVIIYSGDSKFLPDIFERINTGSVQLSKYQILAAQWIDRGVTTSNQDIIDAIRRKNRSLEDKGFHIDPYDGERTDFQFSLYEYLFGLGKIIAEKNPFLFTARAAHEEESIAFALATMVSKLPIAKMSQIENKLTPAENNENDLEKFAQACLEASKFVEEIISPFVGLKLNERKQTHAHSINQIISMISRVIVSKYDVETWNDNEIWQSEKEIFVRTLPQHYLVDLVERNWRGSGDARLFNMTWKQSSEGELSPGNHYCSEFSISRMNSILDNWFENQLNADEVKRVNAKDPTKIFLKYLYCDTISFHNNRATVYEIEHLFPVSRLAALIKSNSDTGWPINCVGNLALFTESTNRNKSNKTLSEYLAGLDNVRKTEVLNQLDRMLFCEVSQISIPDVDGSDKLSKNEYCNFLKERFASMKAKVISQLQLEEPEIEESDETEEVEEIEVVEEEMNYLEQPRFSGELNDIVVTPLPVFFTFGFTIPVEDTEKFIQKYNLSSENKRVNIILVINDQEYDSRIRINKQSTRDVVQFCFLADAQRALTREFQQSYLDVQYKHPASEKCIISHISGSKFSVTKRSNFD